MTIPKLLIIGYARHGKDTVADIVKDKYNLTFKSSSLACSELFIYDKLKQQYGYSSPEECFEDRVNHREEWYDLITEFNTPDKSKLGRYIFTHWDMYVGLRNAAEFHSLKNRGIFDYSIWVDRSEHLPPEDRSSNTLAPWMADFIIDNNSSLEQLRFNTLELFNRLLGVTSR